VVRFSRKIAALGERRWQLVHTRKGQLRLALVSIPAEIYKATKSGAIISFRQLHEPSGNPVKYEKVVPGIRAIDADDIIQGG
jgi:DNA end-binding protein Ku